MTETRSRTILGASLGECVHVAGVLNFLRVAEEEGYHTVFAGPATSIPELLAAVRRERPDVVAVSYRLTPETARSLLVELGEACSQEGLLGRDATDRPVRFIFGGTPPVAAVARDLGMFETVFSGEEPAEAVTAFLRGQRWDRMGETDFPSDLRSRIEWKAPHPILRHHFGLPARTVQPTVEGIAQIAEAQVLDVISLGADQDAQENFFHPERIDPRRTGAGGVPFRDEADLERLYAAARRGNYPLLRSYSGTDDLIRYADVLHRTIHNAWCATSLFWFNAVDGRGPLSLRGSISDHMALMRWHGERNIPVEGNEPHHWELRDGHDAVAVASAYIHAFVARAMGVHDYIATCMFETPIQISNRMDLSKQLAKVELVEQLTTSDFRVLRQTRTGLMSYPLDQDAARAHLAASVYLQMALRPHIVHVVGYCEADHAASAQEVISSCRMARRAIENALRGSPDMARDPAVQRRKEALLNDAMTIVEGIRRMGRNVSDDPLLDVEVLARAVELGLLDAPHLRGNPRACGMIRTAARDGAIVAVDSQQHAIHEEDRVSTILLQSQGQISQSRSMADQRPSEPRRRLQ
ncbi:MAG: cobalamin B12-binding domain-containing protein [Chloroflexi bacterium]|nr:cobalamin B12-binding domain-containing protein [Chloroflexota bacterium]